ncbi:hypothetical protein C8R46DRAFT_1074327 [Mycena filopes]|nr:hypothetical protein C8R46DRAFT_1074327 [Mycena filopes]
MAPTCTCQEGWLSPRTKFVLQTSAATAPDLIKATEDFAEIHEDPKGGYLTDYMPAQHLPRGNADAAVQWVHGFAMLFDAIKDIFEAGRIPTASELEGHAKDRALAHWNAYSKAGADCEMVLEALVQGVKDNWDEGDFKDEYEEELEALPACDEHDFDWGLVEDHLVG